MSELKNGQSGDGGCRPAKVAEIGGLSSMMYDVKLSAEPRVPYAATNVPAQWVGTSLSGHIRSTICSGRTIEHECHGGSCSLRKRSMLIVAICAPLGPRTAI